MSGGRRTPALGAPPGGAQAPDGADLTPAPELELAGYIAPIIRRTDERVLRRKVITYDRKTGETTGEATMREVVGALAKATSLELDVVGTPAMVPCSRCGMPTAAPLNKRRRRARTVETVKEARDRGETLQSIADRLGISRSSVHRAATRLYKPPPSTRLAVCRRCARVKLGARHCDDVCACGAKPGQWSRKRIVQKRKRDPSYVWKCQACFQKPTCAQETCACGAIMPKRERKADKVEKRGGVPWECAACRPTRQHFNCSRCLRPVRRSGKSGMCAQCYREHVTKSRGTCLTCDAVPKREYLRAAAVRQRKGRPWQCWECAHGSEKPGNLGRPKRKGQVARGLV